MSFAPASIPSRTQYVLDTVKHAILTGAAAARAGARRE